MSLLQRRGKPGGPKQTQHVKKTLRDVSATFSLFGRHSDRQCYVPAHPRPILHFHRALDDLLDKQWSQAVSMLPLSPTLRYTPSVCR